MAFKLLPRAERYPLTAPVVREPPVALVPPPLEELPSALALELVQGRRRVWLGVTGGALADGSSETLSFDWRQVPGVMVVGHPRWCLTRLHAALRGSVAAPHLEVDSAAAQDENLALDVLLTGTAPLELVTPLPTSWAGIFTLTVTNRSGAAGTHRVVAALERWDDVCR